MRARPLVLAALVGAAGAGAALIAYRHARPRPQAPPLLAVSPASLTRITAAAAGHPRLVLRRRGRHWQVARPVRAAADASRVAALIADLAEPVRASYPASAVAAGSAGLAPPVLTLCVNGRRLQFGAVNPATLLRYVRRDGSVLLVMDRIAPTLQLGPWPFVDRHPVPPGAHASSVVLPGGRAAAPRQVHAWQIAAARRLAPADATETAGKPVVEVRLSGRPAPLRFAVLSRRPELRLARPDLGIVYVFDARAAALLLGAAAPPLPGTQDDARTSGSRNDAAGTRAARAGPAHPGTRASRRPPA